VSPDGQIGRISDYRLMMMLQGLTWSHFLRSDGPLVNKNKIVCHDFMKRDFIAPMRKTKKPKFFGFLVFRCFKDQ